MRRQLERIFQPKTVALIGGSSRPESPGHALVRQFTDSSFGGLVYVINPKYKEVEGLPCYASLDQAPKPPDLAVASVPARYLESVTEACGRAGAAGMVILTGGSETDRRRKEQLYDRLRQLARTYQMRLLGPNSYGLINPWHSLRATLSALPVGKGNLALITQSGALGASVLDWADAYGIGFSCYVSIGAMIDIEYSDLIDYLGADGHTACILVYMEDLRKARTFMSAARAFARSKPILILRSGRSQPDSNPVLETMEVPPRRDTLFSAAFRRAGLLRVDMVSQLFNCAQALALQPRPLGPRLAVISNAAGPGLLATDFIDAQGEEPVQPDLGLLRALRRQNVAVRLTGPSVTLSRGAGPEEYQEALQACLQDEEVDGVLVVYAPQIGADPVAIAAVVGETAKRTGKPILASWMGETHVAEARERLEADRIPNYRFPESAADTFLRMYRYHRNLELLQETPPAIPLEQDFQQSMVTEIFTEVRAQGRRRLSEAETRRVLQAYQIPVNDFRVVSNSLDAVAFAENHGYPVAMKIASPDILHKSEAGAVRLNITHPAAIHEAFEEIIANARHAYPTATLQGVLVESMVDTRFELLLAGQQDRTFGPVLLFGRGGRDAPLNPDVEIALPPLNLALARRLVERTRISSLLQGYRGLEGANLDHLYTVLVRFAYLLMDFPDILEININPLVIDTDGCVAVDANLRLTAAPVSQTRRYDHLIISPYPTRYMTRRRMRDGRQIELRPIRPEDEPLVEDMLNHSSRESLYFRFFGQVPRISHQFLTRFTQNDYDREIAIIALLEKEAGEHEMVGVVRLVADAWSEGAEYAIMVADPYHGQGLGTILTEYILEVGRDMGWTHIHANVLATNQPMISLFRKFGFRLEREDFETFFVEKDLTETKVGA